MGKGGERMIANRFNPLGSNFKPYAYELAWTCCDGAYLELDMYLDELAACGCDYWDNSNSGALWGGYAFITGMQNMWSGDPIYTFDIALYSAQHRIAYAFKPTSRADRTYVNYAQTGYKFWRRLLVDLESGVFSLGDQIIKSDLSFEMVKRPQDKMLALALCNNRTTIQTTHQNFRVRNLWFKKRGVGLVYDFIPVVDKQGVVCWFNKVDGTLHYPVAGTFIEGDRL